MALVQRPPAVQRLEAPAAAAPRRAPAARRRAAPRPRAAAAAAAEPVAPVAKSVAAFAPATVANLGPGFDWLGCAVGGPGDTVVATALPGRPGVLEIEGITGDGGRLSLDPAANCCGIAARETLRLMARAQTAGVSLRVEKGLPLGSGLGSSAASAAAAAAAVNALFGAPLAPEALVAAGLESEAAVSGRHADNIAPALLGGFVLIRACAPTLDLQRLPYGAAAAAAGRAPDDLYFVLVNPRFEAPTAEMRAALSATVPMASAVRNGAWGASLVAGILNGDAAALGAGLGADCIVEPVRGPLIPGFMAVKEAAGAAGAFGCTISGAGPTAVAVVGDPETAERVKAAMVAAFVRHGGLEVNSAAVVRLDTQGARVV
jgi:homoserine kinase